MLQQSLTRSTGIAFGSSVAVDGDTLIAATQYYSPALDPGPLVFVRRNGTWTQQAELRPSNTGYRTGARVVLDGDTALVATVDGGVYAFVRSGEVWTQQQQLLAEHYAGNGIRLALEGDTALVGAPDENVGANRSQGAVFVYTRAGGVWTRQATLTATPGRASELFGFSLGFSDGTALVVGDEVYQFTRSGDTWIQQPSLPLPPAPILSFRPISATIDGDTAIVLMNVDPRAPTYAYVYRRVTRRWLRLETPGNAMNYVIRGGTMFGGDGGQSGEGRVVVFAVPERAPTGPPSAPLNVRATVSGNIVSLAWDAPYSGSLPSGYTLVSRATAGGPVLAAVPMGSGTVVQRDGAERHLRGERDGQQRRRHGAGVDRRHGDLPQAVVPLGPPVGLLGNVSGATVSFSWNPPSRGGPVTSYVLWAGLTPSVVPVGDDPGGGSNELRRHGCTAGDILRLRASAERLERERREQRRDGPRGRRAPSGGANVERANGHWLYGDGVVECRDRRHGDHLHTHRQSDAGRSSHRHGALDGHQCLIHERAVRPLLRESHGHELGRYESAVRSGDGRGAVKGFAFEAPMPQTPAGETDVMPLRRRTLPSLLLRAGP